MIPYTELLNESLGLLEIDSNDAERFLIDQSLWQAQRHLLNVLPNQFLINAIKTTRFNLVVRTRDYQWPTDHVRTVEMWVDYLYTITVLNPGRKVTPYRLLDRHVSNIDSIASKNYPFYDDNVEGGFGLYPVPDANVTEGCRLRYVWDIPAPTSTQECLLETNLKNLLIYKAVSLSALIEEHNLELSKQMNAKFVTELQLFLPKEKEK